MIEFLGRAELLLMPLPPVTLQLVLMFVAEDEQDGSRDDKALPVAGGNTQLFEDVLDIEELDC